MAEQEVIKHTKNILKVWGSKDFKIWHKMKDSLLEIFIIVFAITLSIWFHNKSEHAHQQQEVKQFLVGLKSDLVHDVAEMQGDKESYTEQKAAFRYITHIKIHEPLLVDSLRKYVNWIFNETALDPNNGRFEGFKSSGKIGEIENEELQNDVMDLYQEDITALRASTEGYVSMKRRLFEFISRNSKRVTDSTTNLPVVLAEDEAQSLCVALSSPTQVLERYDECIQKMKKLIGEINEEYHLPASDDPAKSN